MVKLPQEFLSRMEAMLQEEYPAFLETYKQPEHKGLRRNPLKMGEEEFEEKMPFSLRKVPWAHTGYYYDMNDHPGQHPYHQAGLYYIQEPSAMAVVEELAVEPGEKVLDLCAAPGGKSTQIAGYLLDEGLLVCNEPHPARAKILSENIERMGVKNALVTSELPAKLAEIFPSFFDKILVDAPCSGEGMFRKNEEARGEWSLKNISLCVKRQEKILKSAAGMLRPGGILVYSTCTFSREENEDNISGFVKSNTEFSLLKEHRLWPHKIEGEGHYFAVLKKAGIREKDREYRPAGGFVVTFLSKKNREFEEFAREVLSCGNDWRLYLFGDNLYHLPEEMPSFAGVKVLRPGLHLGTVKKNHFFPSHALALALRPGEVKRVWNLSSGSKEVTAYLKGETFPAEGEKGWYLITVDGHGIGWGKLAGGIMKNHYPKGLRRYT